MHSNTTTYVFFFIGPKNRRLFITETMNKVSMDKNEARRIPTSDVDDVMAGLEIQLANAWDEAVYFTDLPDWKGYRFKDITMGYENADS